MNGEDARVAPAVARALPEIVRLVDAVFKRLSAGGRLIYVGAGTSGRLAMLDAVECVPTFGIPPAMVTALVAGGHEALVRAIEGAEDDEQAGKEDLLALGPTAQDVVVGVTASGRAGYVFTALQAAHQAGCLTAVVLCNGNAPIARMADLRVLVEPGPEIIAGSTRLKAGTAQKLVLNMISTLTMVRLGRTLDNRMIGVRPTNAKLRERSIGLVRELTSCSESEAEAALDRAEWDAPLAALSLHFGSLEDARRALTKSGMNVRDALLRADLGPR
jgi:N-acetylmuramic acid 6-phosphate etherase